MVYMKPKLNVLDSFTTKVPFIETSPLIYSADQWTSFYIIGNSVIKELRPSYDDNLNIMWTIYELSIEAVFQLGQAFSHDLRCEQSGIRSNPKKSWVQPGAVACTCNPAILEAQLPTGVRLKSVWGNSSSLGGWIVRPPVLRAWLNTET